LRLPPPGIAGRVLITKDLGAGDPLILGKRQCVARARFVNRCASRVPLGTSLAERVI
jgi:hypothetical protein